VIREGSIAQNHKRSEPVMKDKVRFLGLDVHAETTAVAVAEPDGAELIVFSRCVSGLAC
jgi:hypothetical protein